MHVRNTHLSADNFWLQQWKNYYK